MNIEPGDLVEIVQPPMAVRWPPDSPLRVGMRGVALEGPVLYPAHSAIFRYVTVRFVMATKAVLEVALKKIQGPPDDEADGVALGSELIFEGAKPWSAFDEVLREEEERAWKENGG